MNFDELVSARMNEQLITHPKYNGVYRMCEPIEGKQPDGTWVMGMVYQDVDTLTKYWRPITMFDKFSIWEGGE